MRPIFEVSTWNNPFNDQGWLLYRVGTVSGQWRSVPGAYEILSFVNDNPGNGDFGHTMDWFEESCKRDGYNLRIREVSNKRLRKHLVEKRGFKLEINYDYIKSFNP